MALKKLPYKRLQHLIGPHLSTGEDASTQKVIDDLSASKKRGYFTKSDLVMVCRWKSPRAIHHIHRNRAGAIRKITALAFATRSEQKKLSLLMSLHGVGVPMASSILMFTNPTRYGVLDIRVWQLLYKMGTVTGNEDGVNFTSIEWRQYLMLIRSCAKKHNVGARDIERTLFMIHRRRQKGTLYEK